MRPTVMSSRAALVAVALIAASTAASSAATVHRAHAVTSLTVADPAGGVTAKAGTMKDLDGSIDSFKPGRGTAAPVTAADRQMDLTSVSYRIVRSGASPALTITYTVSGAIAHSDTSEQTSTDYVETLEADGLATFFPRGYSVQTENDGTPKDSGLMDEKGKQVPCHGYRATMTDGSSVVTQVLPLRCLAKIGLSSARLRSVAAHFHAVVSGSLSTGKVTTSVHVSADPSARTKRVDLAARTH